MPKVEVNDIEMYYEVKGEGPKLCFISGSYGDLRRTPNVFDSPLAEQFKILAARAQQMGEYNE